MISETLVDLWQIGKSRLAGPASLLQVRYCQPVYGAFDPYSMPRGSIHRCQQAQHAAAQTIGNLEVYSHQNAASRTLAEYERV